MEEGEVCGTRQKWSIGIGVGTSSGIYRQSWESNRAIDPMGCLFGVAAFVLDSFCCAVEIEGVIALCIDLEEEKRALNVNIASIARFDPIVAWCPTHREWRTSEIDGMLFDARS